MDKDSIQTILEQYSIIKRHGQRQHTNYTGTVFYNKEAVYKLYKDSIQTILEQYSIIKRHGQRQHTNYTGTVFYNKEAWTKTAYKLYWNSIL